jgi:hypothetical protein
MSYIPGSNFVAQPHDQTVNPRSPLQNSPEAGTANTLMQPDSFADFQSSADPKTENYRGTARQIQDEESLSSQNDLEDLLHSIHPTPLWIESSDQGKIAYFDDTDFIGRMPKEKFSIRAMDKNVFRIDNLETGKSSLASRTELTEKNWHLLRTLDGFEVSKNYDPEMVAQWKVYNGEHDSNGKIVNPGIRVFHGTKNEEAWDYIRLHGVTVEGQERFAKKYQNRPKTFASSSYEVPLSYSGQSGRVGRFIGKPGNFLKWNEEWGAISPWPSEYNISFESTRQESVLPDDSSFNNHMYTLNHQEMQNEIPGIPRERADQHLRNIASRVNLRGYRV